jgi:hypothetical protein
MENEIRVYIIDFERTFFDFRSHEEEGDYEAIMDEAERLGDVYSLHRFQEACNNGELFLDTAYILIR